MMWLCVSFLGNILRAVKISRSRTSYLCFQTLWLNNPIYSRYHTNYNFMRLFSSVNQRICVSRCYSLRNCHSFVKEGASQKTSDVEQKITSQNKLKEQVSVEKVKIYFETAKGKKIECLAFTNQNVMNASIENDIAMHGNCNGEAICSTCHVYIDKKYQAFMSEISEEEAEMLDMVPNLEENSRLSCQIIIRKELEGAIFKLPHYSGPSYGLMDDN